MRVDFTVTRTPVPEARLAENVAHARTLGLPYVADRARGRGPLNVIGRGPSVARHVEELRGRENWACGTAWGWCRDNGIDAMLIMSDAQARMADPEYVSGVKRAIVAEHCDPAVFAALKGAEVHLFDFKRDGAGTTAVSMAILSAPVVGHFQVNLFGCDGCYAETTHVNEDIPQANMITLRCNGQIFRTNPQMINQSKELAELISGMPDYVTDRSGGLLAAMVATDGDWELLEWANAPANVREMLDRERNTGNPGWGDDGVADAAAFQARAAQ